jgi:hypothetical protein
VLQDRQVEAGVDVTFANNVSVQSQVSRQMERFEGIDFWRTRYQFGGSVNTSRRVSFSLNVRTGGEILFTDNPYLGSGTDVNFSLNFRPVSRLQSQISLTTSRFVNTDLDEEIFDERILRALTTYQLTDRLTMRNITEYNTYRKTVGLNLLFTYRVNAGTAFYAGYDDRYLQDTVDERVIMPVGDWRRTNRAVFTKLQYLFRL